MPSPKSCQKLPKVAKGPNLPIMCLAGRPLDPVKKAVQVHLMEANIRLIPQENEDGAPFFFISSARTR